MNNFNMKFLEWAYDLYGNQNHSFEKPQIPVQKKPALKTTNISNYRIARFGQMPLTFRV